MGEKAKNLFCMIACDMQFLHESAQRAFGYSVRGREREAWDEIEKTQGGLLALKDKIEQLLDLQAAPRV